MGVVPSLDMTFEMAGSHHYVVKTSWGVFLGNTWCEAYDLAIRARPRP